MGLGSTVKAIWVLLQGTTNPDVVALYNNLYLKLEGAKMGLGKGRKGTIFFVNGGADGVTTGNNANNGLTPATPLLTIAHALTHCVNDNDDFIYCWNVYNQDAFPIVINVTSVHIIGVAGPDGSWPLMDASAGNTPVFTVDAQNCEIAGFSLEGGATTPAINILRNTANMTWIHNCTFGHWWSGAGRDGINFAGGPNFNCIIEDNWFWGGGHGNLTRYGIYAVGPDGPSCATIRRNFFNGVPTGAINLGVIDVVHDCIISDNVIGEGADVLGNAITLGAMADGCIVARNEASLGQIIVVNNPYLDSAGAAANHWMSNQLGIVMHYPSVAV